MQTRRFAAFQVLRRTLPRVNEEQVELAMKSLGALGAKVDKRALAKWLTGKPSTHLEDLALAYACARGDDAAARQFEKRWMPIAARSLQKLTLEPSLVDDVLSWLRGELFAREQGPLLDTYSGKSDLGGWLRAIVVHEGIRRAKRQRRDVSTSAADDIPMPDVELSTLRGAYGTQFTEAITETFASLAVDQRNILRQSFLDGLSIDVLAKLHNIHRATAARRIQSARQALVDGVRARLKASLRLGDSSIDQLMTLNNLQQSLTGLLRKTKR